MAAHVKQQEDVLTMTEAMDYLRISSRNAFYRLLDAGEIQYVNINPGGKYEIRRFSRKALDDFLKLGSDKLEEARQDTGR